jgi:hypothetical protein
MEIDLIGARCANVKDALEAAQARLEINDYEGEEAETIEQCADALIAMDRLATNLAAIPAMLSALKRGLPLALEALADRATSDDDTDRENFAEYQADVDAIKYAIALAEGRA